MIQDQHEKQFKNDDVGFTEIKRCKKDSTVKAKKRKGRS